MIDLAGMVLAGSLITYNSWAFAVCIKAKENNEKNIKTICLVLIIRNLKDIPHLPAVHLY